MATTRGREAVRAMRAAAVGAGWERPGVGWDAAYTGDGAAAGLEAASTKDDER